MPEMMMAIAIAMMMTVRTIFNPRPWSWHH